jgi:hypothetical protein
MRSDFQICHDRARDHVGERVWWTMTTQEQAGAIYGELRKFDLALIAAQQLVCREVAPSSEMVSTDTA